MRKQHEAEYRRQWCEVHLGIDAQTLAILAVKVTVNSVGEAPVLPELLVHIPADESLVSVSASGAYDTRGCHDAIAAGTAQAIIPLRRHARFGRSHPTQVASHNEAMRARRRSVLRRSRATKPC